MILIIHLAALVGQLIAEARSVHGINARELSNRTGVDESQISKYEKSRVIPGIDTTRTLLAGCGFTLAAIPARDAATYRQREALIAAARTHAASVRGLVPWSHDAEEAFYEAVDALAEAEAAPSAASGDPHPFEQLAMLRDQNNAFRDALKRAGDVIALVTGRSS